MTPPPPPTAYRPPDRVVKDVTGAPIAPPSPPPDVRVTVSASPSRVRVGESVTVSGKTFVGSNPNRNAQVVISYDGRQHVTSSDSNGNFSATISFGSPGTKTITVRVGPASASTTVTVEEAPRPPPPTAGPRVERIQSLIVSPPNPRVGQSVTITGNIILSDFGIVPVTITADGITRRTYTDEFGGFTEVVTFSTPGTKTITVSAGGQSASTTINVEPPPSPIEQAAKGVQDALGTAQKTVSDAIGGAVKGVQDFINQATKGVQEALAQAQKTVGGSIAQSQKSVQNALEAFNQLAVTQNLPPPSQMTEQERQQLIALAEQIGREVEARYSRQVKDMLNRLETLVAQVPRGKTWAWASSEGGHVGVWTPPQSSCPYPSRCWDGEADITFVSPVEIFICPNHLDEDKFRIIMEIGAVYGAIRTSLVTAQNQLSLYGGRIQGAAVNFVRDMLAQGKRPTADEIRARAEESARVNLGGIINVIEEARKKLSELEAAVAWWNRVPKRSLAPGDYWLSDLCGIETPTRQRFLARSGYQRSQTISGQQTSQVVTSQEQRDPILEQLRERKRSLMNRLASVRSELESLRGEESRLPSLIDLLRTQVDSLRNRASNLEAELNDLRARAQAGIGVTEEEIMSRINAVRQEIAQLTARLNEVRSIRDQWRSYVDQLRAQVGGLRG